MQENRKREIRKQANDFREKCIVSRYRIIDLFGECKNCGYKLIRYPVGADAVLGFVKRVEGDTVIFTNTDSRLAREIFTLAHEIGHQVLHMRGKETFIDNEISISGNCGDDKEREANYFAVSLLMPEDMVERFLDLETVDFPGKNLTVMDIARMMSEFNVSFETALNRLENLKKIDRLQRIRLDNERNKKSVGSLLKCTGGNSRLNLQSREIDIPQEFLEYVISNYNHNAIPYETLERALCYYHLLSEDIRDRISEKEPVDYGLDEFKDSALYTPEMSKLLERKFLENPVGCGSIKEEIISSPDSIINS